VTKQELSGLIHLNKETEYLTMRIKELECAASSQSAKITGMPKVLGFSNKVVDYTAEITELKELLDSNLKKCFSELNRLKRYKESIEDSEIRMIMTLRYINGLSWRQIAARISAYATEDSVRMRHDRYLREHGKN
jgi:uncharacterized coiled-coil protein SlyX